MGAILNVVNLNKSFGKNKVLDDVSFKVKKGQILGFIGPNGAGKTTAIKLILGLQSIDSGEVFINDFSIKKDFPKAISRVGSIVENPDLYMYLTGMENLKLVANMYKDVDIEYLNELVKMVKLDNKINDKVAKYSLGMRQRLGIAAALVNKPNILILDEPTNGLDPEGIRDLREIIMKLSKNKKIGVLISSHNLAELDNFCTDICLINNGKIIQTVNIDKLKNIDKAKYIIVLDRVDGINKYLEDNDIVKNKSIIVNREEEEIPNLIKLLVKNKYKIYEVKKDILSLEDAYLKEIGGNILE